MGDDGVKFKNPWSNGVVKNPWSNGNGVNNGKHSSSGHGRNSIATAPVPAGNDTDMTYRGKISGSLSTEGTKHRYHLIPQNGCIKLESGDNQYTTRFRIDSTAERKNASEGVFLEECCLCSQEENRETILKCLAAIIMSEGFLLTFHLGALTLGVAKSCINRENIDEDVELIHSIVEVLAVSFVLFARVMLVWESRRKIAHYRKRHQYMEIGESESVIGRHLNRVVIGFLIICIIFETLVVGAFFIFYYFVHLGWTTLVNNAVLIIGMTLSSLVLSKLEKVRTTIIEDEHKVVLYEATLLLEEGIECVTEIERGVHSGVVTKYINCLMGTELFQQPSHIEIVDNYKLKGDDEVNNSAETEMALTAAVRQQSSRV